MNEMPQKNDDRLAIRLPGELLETLAEIQEKHGLTPTEIARRCLDQVAGFYRENGYFSFPVHIVPNAEFLKAVKGTKSFLHSSDAMLPQVAGKDEETKQTPKPRKTA
jgi:antitoxin component of RelBE/YafQ-DinJ toxin-antitoxin module